jgi:hypothetical protein
LFRRLTSKNSTPSALASQTAHRAGHSLVQDLRSAQKVVSLRGVRPMKYSMLREKPRGHQLMPRRTQAQVRTGVPSLRWEEGGGFGGGDEEAFSCADSAADGEGVGLVGLVTAESVTH